ncbi:uncharacterized protein [Hemitrygon akajei]|uniref:uncharacterized protein n=1 Tax=Hemitrygon akajei TaxID=2704970 RepID=UPI003BF95FF2
MVFERHQVRSPRPQVKDKAYTPSVPNKVDTCAIVNEFVTDIADNFKEISQIYRLDINIANLWFVHHPLFSREHVLAAKLIQLHNNYQERQRKNISQLLFEKLQTFHNVLINLEESSINLSRIEDIKKEIRETKRLLNVEKEKDITLLRNILTVWKQIKSLRKFKKCICTPIKLQVKKLEVNGKVFGKQCEVEYFAEVIELEQKFEEDFRKELEMYNEKLEIWKSKQQYEIPNYFKQASIIPISKKNMATYLNHPVALISSVTKCFARLLMKHINCCLRNYLDLFQFADHQNGSTVDGSISLVLHSALEHLDHEDTHIRMLFIEYHSAFIPSKLITKHQGLGPHFPHWQTLVSMVGSISSTLTLNLGAVCLVPCFTHFMPMIVRLSTDLPQCQQNQRADY